MPGMSRREQRSEESALKYFLLGAFASGFLLYGIAFFDGATGSLSLDSLLGAWISHNAVTQSLVLIGMGFLLIGLCFKSALVPFHQWTPDVLGRPDERDRLHGRRLEIAAIAVLFRLLDAAAVFSTYWMPVLFWIAILTMTVGNLIALAQKDAKRILGYSSIAHAGYILVAILAHAENAPDDRFRHRRLLPDELLRDDDRRLRRDLADGKERQRGDTARRPAWAVGSVRPWPRAC